MFINFDGIFILDEVYLVELIQDVLFEVLKKFQTDSDFSLKAKTKSWNLMDLSENKLNIRFDDSTETILIKYLIDAYKRISGFRIKTLSKQSQEVLEKFLAECRLQITRNVINILTGLYSSSIPNRTESKLTSFLLNQYISEDLVYRIIEESLRMKSQIVFQPESGKFEDAFTSVNQ